MAGLLKMAAAHEKQNVIVQRLQAKSVKHQSLEDACKKQEAVIEKLERLTTSCVEKSGIISYGALQRIFFIENPRLLWKWVGGSRSHLDFLWKKIVPK